MFVDPHAVESEADPGSPDGASALFGTSTREQAWAGEIIDADVHAQVPSLQALFPYLEPIWRSFITERGWPGPAGFALTYPPAAPSSCRALWRPNDELPASRLALIQEHVLDAWGIERAILNCYYGLDSLRHPDWAAALASALNDWLIAEWLERDERLRASIVVPARSPDDMVREIERVGGHPGFVQVLMPVRSDRLYGNRAWHPVYEAMVRHDLVMGLHWGGTSEGPPTPTGWPTWYVEEYAGELQVYTAQITSLVSEGTFQAIPDLRVSVLEIGFLWLPGWAWRMDKDWRGLRREIPWVTTLPSTLIREHMRFSVAPIDAGPPEELGMIVEWLGSDDLLMFASDYPHHHDDDVTALISALPATSRAKLMADNARAWYGL